MIHSHSTNNTPQGTPKKLPPPPPRRSNSVSEATKQDSLQACFANSGSSQPNPITDSPVGSKMGSGPSSTAGLNSRDGFLRRSFNYGYMGVKNNLQPDISADLPPPPPAPHDVGNHQFIHHHPSHRRSQDQMMVAPEQPTKTRPSASDNQPSPPALSDLSVNNAHSPVTSASCCLPDREDCIVSRPRRNDSTVSNCSQKSTSSTDSSDSLPFANDNAGTIKQRYTVAPTGAPPHPSIPPHILPGVASPIPSPSTLRRVGNPHRASLHKNSPARSTVNANGNEDGNADVLSDIGNMLANLTDELDAMLEQEMTT